MNIWINRVYVSSGLAEGEAATGLDRGEPVGHRPQAPGGVDGRRSGEAVAAQHGQKDVEQLAAGGGELRVVQRVDGMAEYRCGYSTA